MLVHGLLDSSDAWICNGNRSYAFQLANLGYDVYLPNTRGNSYSKLHETLDSENDIKYWEQTHAYTSRKYDIPAFIEFAKEKSNVKNVTVVGHSQAAFMMFSNLAQNASYFNESVNLLVALAPLTKPATPITVPNFIMVYSHFYIYDPLSHYFNMNRYF